MGSRGQILIKDTGVYLYTHYSAMKLPEMLHSALSKKLRLDDPEYLARIIFCEMVKDDLEGELNFGIDTILHDDVWLLLVVDCEKQKVTVKNLGQNKVVFDGSIEDYINDNLGEWWI
ncbi:MAG: hypothetical protein GTN97_03310 [Nitrosopumilaceae archaeon]|nr:hypothetical protein [Nitrosopumilaceae archaeon]